MRMMRVAVALLLLAGCKKSSEPTTAPPPEEKKPEAVTEFAVPTAASTLSVLEPAGAGCEWRQVDPVAATKVVLATFPGSCVGARIAWSPDASKAIVWFDPEHVQRAGYSSQVSSKPGYAEETVDENAKPRAFVVSTRKPSSETLTLPSLPKLALRELGVDGKGNVLALLEEEIPEGSTGVIESHGSKFDLSSITEGLPVLVHAYRREGAEWKHQETKLSTTGWDYGLGVKELEAFGALGPRSVELSSAHAQGDAVEGDALAPLMKLVPKGTTADDGSWIFLGTGGARLYVWEVTGEFAYTTGLIASDGAVLPKLGFTDGDLVSIRTSGPHVLISGSDVGTHPRLYAMPGAKLVFSSDTARAATFWPTTAKPETHE